MDCSKRSVASRRFETDLSKAESLRNRGEYEDAAAQYSLLIRHLECEPSCDGTTARLIRALESYGTCLYMAGRLDEGGAFMRQAIEALRGMQAQGNAVIRKK